MLFRQTAVYMLANIIGAILGLIGVMLFTRLLTPAQYGVYIVALTSAGIVNALLFNWGRHAILRHHHEEQGRDVRLSVLGGYFLGILLLPLALLIAVFFFEQPVERMILAFVLGASLGFFELGQEILRVRLDSHNFMIAAITRAFIAFLLGILAIYLGWGGVGLSLAAILAFVLASLVRFPRIWSAPRAPFNRAQLHILLRYGLPITVSGFLFAWYAALDRLSIAWLLGDMAAGRYGAAADLTRQIMTFPALAIGSAIVPMAMRFLNEGDEAATQHHLARSAELLMALLLPSAIGLAIIAPHMAQLFLGAQFSDSAARLLPILAFAWLLNGLSQYYLHVSFQLANKPIFFIAHGFIGVSVSAFFIPALILFGGERGAAFGLLITEGAVFLGGIVLMRVAHPIPLPLKPIVRIAVASLFMGGITSGAHHLLSPQLGLWSLPITIIVGALSYGTAVMALDILHARHLLQRFLHAHQRNKKTTPC